MSVVVPRIYDTNTHTHSYPVSPLCLRLPRPCLFVLDPPGRRETCIAPPYEYSRIFGYRMVDRPWVWNRNVDKKDIFGKTIQLSKEKR